MNNKFMRIYKFQFPGGEKDWVFAPTMKEAKVFYLNHTQCGDLDSCHVSIVPKKEWSHNVILDINEMEPDPDDVDYDEDDYACGYKIQQTFAEYAEKNTSTDLICTTEF